MPESENRIDIHQIDKSVTKEMPFPVKVENELRVYIDPTAYNQMKQHAEITDEVELCGVLIGDVCSDEMGFFVNICGIIEGEGANNYGAQVTFTHDTWSHINDIKDSKFQDQKIVGWYHTHPGFGVFLSEMDSFIQDNFFNQPYQVAIVLETKDQTEGCFCWVNGKSTPLERYWVGSKEVQLVTGKAEEFSGGHKAAVKSGSNGDCRIPQSSPINANGEVPMVYIMMIGLITLVLGFMFGNQWGKEAERVRFLDTEVLSIIEYAAQAKLMNLDLEKIQKDINTVKSAMKNSDPQAASKELADIESFITNIKNIYTKNRGELRQELDSLRRRKSTISDRVAYNTRKSEELSQFISELYIVRLQEIMNKVGDFNPQIIDRQSLQALKIILDRAIMDFPQNKHTIRMLYPKLMDYYYPQQSPQPEQQPERPATPAI